MMFLTDLELEQVFREHAAFTWRVLLLYGVREADLEDACQEVFLILHRTWSRFEGRSALRTFLYGICRRVASNERQRAVRRYEVVTDRVPEPAVAVHDAESAFTDLVHKEGLALLDALLQRLSSEQREVFVLYEIEELGMREVAELVGCPLTTAFSRLYAARGELASQLHRLRMKGRVA